MEFELWVERRECLYRTSYDTDLFRFGNKPGRLLANLAKGRRVPTLITALKNNEGCIETDPKKINKIPRTRIPTTNRFTHSLGRTQGTP